MRDSCLFRSYRVDYDYGVAFFSRMVMLWYRIRENREEVNDSILDMR